MDHKHVEKKEEEVVKKPKVLHPEAKLAEEANWNALKF